MKLTVITNQKGELDGLVHAHLSEHDRNKSYKNGPHATLRPGPGQRFHEIELPVECEKLPAPELRRRALEQAKKAK
ncbi:MAG: hypothetical protein WAL32_19125 [Terriglobales bacterium]